MNIKYLKYIFGALLIMGGLILHSCSSYSEIIKESYQKLETYNVKKIDTEYRIGDIRFGKKSVNELDRLLEYRPINKRIKCKLSSTLISAPPCNDHRRSDTT
jgi:hypothetical protein